MFRNTGALSFQIVSSLLVVFGLGSAVLFVAGQNAIRIVDQSSLAREQRLASHSLSTVLAAMPRQQRSATLWDDAVRYTISQNEEWMDSNLGSWMQDYFGHDESYVLDRNNEPFFASVSGTVRAPEVYESRADAIAPLVAQLRNVIANVNAEPSELHEVLAEVAVTQPVQFSNVVALVSIVPIISETGNFPQVPGTEALHIAIRYVDENLAQEISRPIELNGATFQTAQPSKAQAGVPLAGPAGNVVSWLVWRPERPGMALFDKMLPVLLPVALVSVLVVIWLVRNLLRVSGKLQAREAQARLDVVAINKAKEEAEAADRAKVSFLSVLSHELRTPLTVILGFSRIGKNLRQLSVAQKLEQQLKRRPAEMSQIESSVDEMIEFTTTAMEKIDKSGEHLLFLVNQLLDYAKLETGSLKINPEVCDVQAVLDPVVDQMTILAEQKNLRLETSIGSCLIWADVTRTRQIIINLLGNAIKFTDSGTVSVIVRETEEWVHIDVSDTGTGISEQELERIFEAFHQTDASATRRAAGTGLGLSVARELAQLEGGTIEVRSEIGVGSTFTLSLRKERSPDLKMVA